MLATLAASNVIERLLIQKELGSGRVFDVTAVRRLDLR
jgi:hypothetical protein